MKVLVVGAGAVGQVYAWHLQKGGAQVSLLVKPKYAQEARSGFTLYPLQGNRAAVRLENVTVLDDVRAAAAQTWDQVWLCVPSNALDGELLEVLCPALGDATLVALTPGLEDRARLGKAHAPQKVVAGVITMVSYQAPLPGEQPRAQGPGVAFWFPPFTPTPLSGDAARVDAVVAALRAGGCPAAKVEDASVQGAMGSAVLMPVIASLEAAGWRFTALAQGDQLKRASQASAEAQAVVAAFHGIPVPSMAHLLGPNVFRLVLKVAPWATPLPLETYLAYHFKKTGVQTRMMLATYSKQAQDRGLPHAALDGLAALLGPASPHG